MVWYGIVWYSIVQYGWDRAFATTAAAPASCTPRGLRRYAILCYAIRYCTILYCTILYYTILYYTRRGGGWARALAMGAVRCEQANAVSARVPPLRPALESGISLWNQGSPFAIRDFHLESGISLWNQGLPPHATRQTAFRLLYSDGERGLGGWATTLR